MPCAAVILMEGGTERDLLSLDHTSDQEEEEEEEEVEEAKPEPVIKKEDSVPREEQSVSSHDKDSNECEYNSNVFSLVS